MHSTSIRHVLLSLGVSAASVCSWEPEPHVAGQLVPRIEAWEFPHMATHDPLFCIFQTQWKENDFTNTYGLGDLKDFSCKNWKTPG